MTFVCNKVFAMYLDKLCVVGVLLLVAGSESGSLIYKHDFNDNTLYDEVCDLPQSVLDDISGYQNVTNLIIDHFTRGAFKGQTWTQLVNFVDKFGHRIAGSQALEDSIDYMLTLSRKFGLENINTEDVEVPHWIRGEESVQLLKPRIVNLPMLGFGYSIGTPPGGITASVVVVKSFNELQALPDDKVRGKIVVYDQEYVSYGETVKYRSKGASAAAKRGAVAALVRSITPYSHATPHTGMMSYEENCPKIPVAAITHEDADMLWRFQQRGEEIVIKLFMSATIEQKISRNTMVELTGSSKPDNIVFVSGHIDSWDVGVGAMDDGGGLFISWVAPIVLKSLNLRPKRTLRTYMWTAEELGLIGARSYSEKHAHEFDKINFAMESDFGAFKPFGLIYQGSKKGECMMREILKLFKSINATRLELDSPGPDIGFWVNKGVPGGGLLNDDSKYFWYHHSAADRMNVFDPDDLDLTAAFWTAFSYIVADMDQDIPR